MQNKPFNYEEALEKLKAGQAITGEDGVLTPLLKQMTEALLQGEVDEHLESDSEPNRRNGKSRKQVKSGWGSFELETPRDRAGTFEPQLVKKNQTTLGNEIEEKILSLYGLGITSHVIIFPEGVILYSGPEILFLTSSVGET